MISIYLALNKVSSVIAACWHADLNFYQFNCSSFYENHIKQSSFLVIFPGRWWGWPLSLANW